ncbi:hypothetical protein Tco_0169117 [Tanacetum coccineum]
MLKSNSSADGGMLTIAHLFVTNAGQGAGTRGMSSFSWILRKTLSGTLESGIHARPTTCRFSGSGAGRVIRSSLEIMKKRSKDGGEMKCIAQANQEHALEFSHGKTQDKRTSSSQLTRSLWFAATDLCSKEVEMVVDVLLLRYKGLKTKQKRHVYSTYIITVDQGSLVKRGYEAHEGGCGIQDVSVQH